MDRQATARIATAIGRMLVGFPSASNPEAGRVYLEAVIDLPPQCVERAAERFIAGTVERSTHAFPPSVAEFARQCRMERVDGGVRLSAPPAEAGPGPEERKRMAGKMQAFVRDFTKRFGSTTA